MASREKKPLAPAKSKQKANNNFGSASVDAKPKKSKNLIKHQAIICDIIEAVATNSQLPPKLEAGLPRKKALSSLKCKSQKLKVVKSGLLKAKQKVPIKSLKRINSDKRPIGKAKKVKEENPSEKNCDEVTFDGSKSAKNNIRASKKKPEEEQSPKKASPKVKKGTDSPARSVKAAKSLVPKGQKEAKSKKSIVIKEEEEKCSIDLTIDEVIASMLSDSEDDKGKKMLVSEAPPPPPLLDETQIKKELIEEEERVSDEELADQQAASNSLKKKPKPTRSLRNGKLRLSDSGISIDLELSRRRKRLDSEDPAIPDQASDGNVDSESCMSENSAMEAHNIKEEDTTNHMDSGFELGTTGLGDSSSGANRKISTNHRPLCDEDEETPPKDRQSLVIPEKSSSFSIHPERLCADVCCYCHGKFGSLDTPMHLAQIKSDDRMKKILVIERHLTKDSCLCDACFRHVDRKAHVSPTNMQSKPQKQHRQLMNTKCAARDCKETAKHNVKRRWLIKIKSCVQNQMDIDWESSQHSSMSFCVIHYPKIEKYLTCSLCKRRLAKNHTHLLPHSETAELNQLLAQHGIPVDLVPGTFVCKLCRYFTQIQLKYKDLENMGSSTKNFFKNYRKRILQYHNIEVEDDDEPMPLPTKEKDLKDKEKESKPHHTPAKKASSKCISNKQHSSKVLASKSPDLASTSNPPSRKSTPEPLKTSTPMSETSQSRASKTSQEEPLTKTSSSTNPSIQYLTIESTIEKLKKRKAIDSANNHSSIQSANDVVEILAMDKEVTLTRLPKRPKTQANSQDITPVVQRLGANPSISVRTLFPGEEEMNLHANIEFNNVREVTPQGWEKCSSIIQYDRDTKLLWQTLQRPYGNQSSFLRHLVLLEKYYRAGDLVLAPKASHNALNYSTSVRNRLISYEGPEKMDEPINEPEFPSPQRSFYERPGSSKVIPLTSGVSIIKKPPPSLQRINAPSTSQATKKSVPKQPVSTIPGGQVFQMSEPEYKKFQTLKKQKQMDKGAPFKGSQNQKTQHISQQQFQEHLRKQQEMLSRQSRGDFEPIICDARSSANENSPAQSLLNNLNLPKSIQVTTKPPVPISLPIMPKIPKSLTVIPQTVTRPSDK